MPIRKSADTSALLKKVPQAEIAIKQLDLTRSQDWARVFLPSGDIEMANHCANILTQHKDVASEMSSLRTALEKIYTEQVKPHLS
ncbi:MAG: hypothetical protein QM638_05480 [Nocardioides sp.]|uniref:hypothetical protein n=1 Tax=Nocardioides sp. TaxID=35761 RepID=UPI0039E69772